MQTSNINIHDGSTQRKKKKRTKALLPGCDRRILDEMQWDIPEDILERVLARLPVSCLFWYRSVCKGWSSLIYSPSFLKACSEVPSRSPWFYMVDPKCDGSYVYDTEVNRWHHVKLHYTLTEISRLKPVASAGGLLCFRSVLGQFIVFNPLTASYRELPPMDNGTRAIHAIAMVSFQHSYKLFVICGEIPALVVKVYDSSKECWDESSMSLNTEEATNGKAFLNQRRRIEDDNIYYLNKGGNVVTRHMWHNTSKEFSSILTLTGNGNGMLYFLNKGGKIVSCNMQKHVWNELPPLLPSTSDYSIDLVNCGGRMLVVLLHEMMESASVRIWEYNDLKGEWVHVLSMPPSMSHEYFGKKADISCAGYNNLIIICILSRRINRTVVCDILGKSWRELPRCYVPGSRKLKRFVSAYPFEPRIEASV